MATAIGICASVGQAPLSHADIPAALVPQSGYSLIGTPLRKPAFSENTLKQLEEDLEIAKARLRIAPNREDSYIWLGRRHGYLGDYAKAVEVFSAGLERFPESYRLLRYRGRHLARSRMFEQAITDYRQAASLMENVPDTVEPDGMPNALGLPLGTYKSNIHYYWAQTSFAVQDYETMLTGMEKSMEFVLPHAYNDLLVPTSLWRYIALMKLGRAQEADAVLAAVPNDLTLIENYAYYDALLHLKGELEQVEAKAVNNTMLAFAAAMKDQFEGRHQAAEKRLHAIVGGSALGFWPAEVELVTTYAYTPR
ncbi:tetratricopeptide repeat protein [Kordiimonas sp.]|uniref:tetratricopeptide repeat protein n=1 Tax=Kordiimonas sp. TaxID=1970157 RepID=UPI003A915E3D